VVLSVRSEVGYFFDIQYLPMARQPLGQYPFLGMAAFALLLAMQ